MTNKEKNEIIRLQKEGMGYRAIAACLSLPVDSVKSWCRRHPNDQADECLCCGAAIHQTPQKRRRKFCSDRCRNAWWSAHPEMRSPKALYHHVCLCCGKDFSNSRISASYCSRACFARARMKEQPNG